MKIQRPPKLRKNSKVAVISPSSNPDHVGIKMGIDILKKAGLRVELGDTTRKLMTVGTLAAEDKARAHDFNWAFEDDTVGRELIIDVSKVTRLDTAGVAYTASLSGRAALFCRDPDANTFEFVGQG